MRIELAVKPLNQKKQPGVYQLALHFFTDSGAPVFSGSGMRYCTEGEKAGEIWDARIHTPKFWITIGKIHPTIHDRVRRAASEIIEAAHSGIEQVEASRRRKLTSDEKAAIWAQLRRPITDPPEPTNDD